jgi:hypothetical protein
VSPGSRSIDNYAGVVGHVPGFRRIDKPDGTADNNIRQMDHKKTSVVLVLSFLTVSFLGAQSLAEMAKKEKERRNALKKKPAVITNVDLAKVKKKSAVSVSTPDAPPGEAQGGIGDAVANDVGAPQAPRAPFTVRTATSGNANLSDSEQEQTREALKQKWDLALERVDLLTMKMNALWQEFYSLDDMTPRESIQQQISETYEKLLKAQDEEAVAKEELEGFLSRTRKD